MSTRDMHVEIDGSYKRSNDRKIGHNIALLGEVDRGSVRTTGDILIRHHQCGPLLIVNFNKQTWSQDCVVTFKYHKAQQRNSESLDTNLTFIGEWELTNSYPTEDDYTESILEVGDYWIITDDITITPPAGSPNTTETFKTGEFIICESIDINNDPIWVKGEIGWYTKNVRGVNIEYPIWSPVLDETTGDVAEFTATVTIPAGTRAYVQHFYNSDYVYEIYDLSMDDNNQHVRIYSLADNGMRLLYGFNTEYLRNIIEYLRRRYFPVLDECPTCEGTGLVDGSECPECEGYKYLANPNSDIPPDIEHDYITDLLAQSKEYRKQSETWESYRWKVWSKYWWKIPITEKIKEYVGHFLRIDPESINIVKPVENSDGVIPECVWKIEIELDQAGDIIDIESTDSNIKQLIYEIAPAGTNVIVARLIGYTDGDYDVYADNEVNQLNYGGVVPDAGQDILSGRIAKTHFEDVIFSSGMEVKQTTYASGAGTTSLVVAEDWIDSVTGVSDLEDCSGYIYVEETKYTFTDFDSATKTFTLTSNYGTHTETTLEVYYVITDRVVNGDYTDFYNGISQDDYIKYIEMDVPISIIDSTNTVRKWDDKI